MQKAASLERKIILKEQKNLIKHQLLMDNILSKMKVNGSRERRLSGPLKVVQSHSQSIRSETSIARRSSTEKDKDVVSLTSQTHSVISRVSEVTGEEIRSKDVQFDMEAMDLASRLSDEASGVPISQIKQSLLMREAALQKRRRAAEELLQWHKKLLEKERWITELESTANDIISHKPNRISTGADVNEKHNFKGAQLNQLWFNLTGCEKGTFAEDKTYLISQVELERFCKSAREYTLKAKKKLSDCESSMKDDTCENVPNQKDTVRAGISGRSSNIIISTETLNNNVPDCNVELISEVFNKDVDIIGQNINRLIDDFSMIEKGIYSLSREQSVKARREQDHDNLQRCEPDIQILVNEANKCSEQEEEGLIFAAADENSTSNEQVSAIKVIKDKVDKNKAEGGSKQFTDLNTISSPLKLVAIEENKGEDTSKRTTEKVSQVEKRICTGVTEDLYPLKKSSLVAGDQSFIEQRTEYVFPKQADKITAKVVPPNKKIFKESRQLLSHEYDMVSEGEANVKLIEETAEKNWDILEDTEDLYIIEEPKSELQVGKIPSEEIIIINDEETPIEIIEIEDDTLEVNEINDETELAEETSKETDPLIGVVFNSEVRRKDSLACEKTFGKEYVKGKESPLLDDEVSIHKDLNNGHLLHSAVCADIEGPDLLPKDANTDKVIEQDNLLSPQSSMVAKKDGKSTETDKSKDDMSMVKSPKSETVDAKKRVFEIMADASQVSKESHRPRLQDLYTTTYDLPSPTNSPESEIALEKKLLIKRTIFDTEAEKILKKQLAIEEEIKQITKQQRKEQLSYSFFREIPNKPPPPYVPPSLPVNVPTVIPTREEIKEIAKYSAKLLHKAYLSHNLDNISISENTLGLISKTITKECYKFVFDLCKEISKKHYKQFETEKCPSWLQVQTKPQLAMVKPLDIGSLEKHLIKTLEELFGYHKIKRRENAVINWSRKYRDHVDEVLVMESLTEEAQWTNCDKDKLLVMNNVTNEIMNDLLKETGQVFYEIFSKRNYLY